MKGNKEPDAWDKLWYDKDNRTTTLYQRFDWIKAIKAEGDKLHEKAKKWDTLKTTIIQMSVNGEEWRSLNVMTMIEAEKKIEAIKSVIKKDKEKYTLNEFGDGVQYILKKLEGILEDNINGARA